ncbi:MAG: dipeptidase [Blastocatellia bacterium]
MAPRMTLVMLFTTLFLTSLWMVSSSHVLPAGAAHDPAPAPQQGPPAPAPTPALTGKDAGLWARALKIHRSSIVLDTHNDVTSALLDDGFDLAQNGIVDGRIKTHTDFRRMREGGLNAQFFAVYVGREFVNKPAAEGGGAMRRAMDMIGVVYDQVRKHPDQMEMAFTAADVRRVTRKGKIAALMGIEGGHAIEDSLHALGNFHRLGIRYMTLTHSNTNNWADSEGDVNVPTIRHHNGLTDFGRKVVQEMNRLGMMVDISHVADKTFFDAIETAKAPVIASHSSARALSPHTRNMTDDQLRAVAKNGGVVMVNFYNGFIDRRKAEAALKSREMQMRLREQYPGDANRAAEELRKWRQANEVSGPTPLSVLMEHIEHVIKTAGIDHVGMGADFDGIPLDGAPAGAEDVSKYPVITFELLKRGYSETDIRKVLGKNLLRVMSRCEQIAAQMK